MAGPPAPQAMSRIEPITEARFAEATAIHNDFLGARKKLCGCCSYALCPDSVAEFSSMYRNAPETQALSAVAVGIEGTAIGFVRMSGYGMQRDTFSQCLHRIAPGEFYIEEMAVTAAARGRGIGTKLLEWSEQNARARGGKTLTLGVVSGNPAQRLYERFGFVARPRGPCEGACSNVVICCIFGMPHGQCGGFDMAKPLT